MRIENLVNKAIGVKTPLYKPKTKVTRMFEDIYNSVNSQECKDKQLIKTKQELNLKDNLN